MRRRIRLLQDEHRRKLLDAGAVRVRVLDLESERRGLLSSLATAQVELQEIDLQLHTRNSMVAKIADLKHADRLTLKTILRTILKKVTLDPGTGEIKVYPLLPEHF